MFLPYQWSHGFHWALLGQHTMRGEQRYSKKNFPQNMFLNDNLKVLPCLQMMQMLNSYYKMLDDSLSKYSVYKARMNYCSLLLQNENPDSLTFLLHTPIEECWRIPSSLADELRQRQPHDREWSSSRRERPTLRPGHLRLKIEIIPVSATCIHNFFICEHERISNCKKCPVICRLRIWPWRSSTMPIGTL